MKFKLIFALFNGIVVLSFLFVFLMPLFVLGIEYTAGFWGQNWYLVLVFLGILGALDAYFLANWKLFHLLEREDWKGLAAMLEERIFVRKRYADQSIRLLGNAWVVQGKPQEIRRLEAAFRADKPALVERHALMLGVPYLLDSDPAALVAFFEPLAAQPKAADRDWLRFNLAFGHLSARRPEAAVAILEELVVEKVDDIVRLMSLYLLDSHIPAEGEKRAWLAARKAELARRHTPATFAKAVERERENLEVVILTKFINEAADWFFADDGKAAEPGKEASS